MIFYGIKENTFVRSDPLEELRKVDQQKRDQDIQLKQKMISEQRSLDSMNQLEKVTASLRKQKI